MGHFEAMLSGKVAEDLGGTLRVGMSVRVTGSLWTRTYTDRKGHRMSETKVLVDSIEKDNERDKR